MKQIQPIGIVIIVPLLSSALPVNIKFVNGKIINVLKFQLMYHVMNCKTLMQMLV